MWNRISRMTAAAGAALTLVACGSGGQTAVTTDNPLPSTVICLLQAAGGQQLTVSAQALGTAAGADDCQGDADQRDDRSEDGPRRGVGHRTVADDDAETLQGEHDPEERDE